jgi:CBS domain-containing protein
LITCFEVLRELTRAISEGATAPLPVSSIMMRDPMTIAPETLTLDAIALMRREKVDCLPVINQGRLVGIVTERDFINVAARLLEQEPRHLKASAVGS